MRGVASKVVGVLFALAAASAHADVTGTWRVEGGFLDPGIVSMTQVGSDVTVAGATISGLPFALAGTVTGDVLSLADPAAFCPAQASLRVLPGERIVDGRGVVVGGTCTFPFIARLFATRCTCFDGNTDAGDGCDPQCQVEECWTCGGDPSTCAPIADGGACDDRRDCTTATTCATGVCGGGTVVPACIDLTGIWDTLYTSFYAGPIAQTADVVQEGGVVLLRPRPVFDPGLVGTVDVVTGALALRRPNLTYFCPDSEGLVGTAAADGRSITGTMSGFTDAVGGRCLFDDGPFEAVRTECGNGVVDPGETCDDGNRDAGDGCAADCRFELCTPGPRPDCRVSRVPSRSTMKLHDRPDGAHDDLAWTWKAGAATTSADFGQPTTTNGVALCLYEWDGFTRLLSAAAPAGGTCGARPCWRATSKGFAYANKAGTPQGLTSIALVAGADGKAKITVKGKGALLSPPAPPLALPVRVQLQIDGGACFETRHDETSVQRNDAGTFQARGAP